MKAAPHFKGKCREAFAYHAEPLRGRMINVEQAPQ